MQPRALPRDMFLDKRVENGHTCLAPFRRSRVRSPTDYLDVAGPRVVGCGPVVRMRRGMGPETAVSRAEIEPTSLIMARATKLLAEIESGLDMAPRTMFATPQAEDEYVRRQVDLQKYLDLLIESGFLTPAHTVTVPGQRQRVDFRHGAAIGDASGADA
ncbi:hypothetical protein DL89DRAFT_104885 [Linderina pennispora]|uniref:Uncharacterized protein n=1 Tax=Linderina pennispora TaxID=61395 RepID=A0A1Y1WER6_9FUNG|nr:uncharacterized protein DL89DRAFT_104885 [Linderina pennispora]ORX71962.1 hypothetical protein DL89DRAFT_104885 [Linderina pennispora]